MNATPDPTAPVPAEGAPQTVEALGLYRLKAERIQLALLQLPGWSLTKDAHSIQRAFQLRTRAGALALTCLIVEISRAQGHEASLQLAGAKLVVTLTSAEIGGVTEADLELARLISLQD